MRTRAGWVLGGTMVAAVVCVPAPAAAQAQRFGNLQVLSEDQPAWVLERAMTDNVRGLGLSGPDACAYCHMASDFASDARPAKVRAREMMAMVARLNRELGIPPDVPDDRFRVTCETCHRGALTPPVAPSARPGAGRAAPAWRRP